MANMFTRTPSVVAGALGEMIVALVALRHQPTWPFMTWIGLSSVLLAWRLWLLARSRSAAEQGRPTPTTAFAASSILWAMIAGLGCLLCDLSGDPALQVLSNACVIAIIGGLTARNASTPRLALTQVLVALSFLCAGAALAPQHWLRMLLIEAPIYALGLANICFRINHEIVALIRAQRENGALARRDSLTGLHNRMSATEAMAALTGSADLAPLAVIAIDLDGFKAVNDTLGHAEGDRVLIETGRRLRGVCEGALLIARLGGDEFLVVLPDDGPARVEAVARAVCAAIRVPYELVDAPSVRIDASLGVACWPKDGADADAVLVAADKALYAVKRAGKADFALYDAERHAGEADLMLFRNDLEAAIRGGSDELELHYQDVTRLSDGRISGREALLRWRHPTLGLVSPADFVPLAEASGLIIPLGEWVLRQACSDAATWLDPVKIAVNVSPVQLRNEHLASLVAQALAQSGLPAHRLEVEVTETVLLSEDGATARNMQRLRALGVEIVLDDFGTGFSSLSNLCRFSFDRIKIDGSFVRDALQRVECAAVVRATVGLARELGMPTTAECIETPEQLAFVRACGCSDVQGFLMGRPKPAAAIARREGSPLERGARLASAA